MEHMKEDYVSFETAKLLNQKGYWGKPMVGFPTSKKHFDLSGICPTQALVLKWLRIKYNIHIGLQILSNTEWSFHVVNISEVETLFDLDGSFDKPEEATEAAIQYTLKNLI